jgi:hypothetical protein
VFAINHAATALLIKRRFPEEPIIPLLLSPAVPGPESLLANRLTAIVLVIFAQIVVTLFLIGFFYLRSPPPSVISRRT